MALVDIDDELKKRLEKVVEKNRVEFPTMKNFCDKAIKAQLEKLDRKNEG
jgi:hypothetical protein